MLLYIICLFVFEKQKGRGITQTPVSTVEPTATVYLYKKKKTYYSQKTAWSMEDCMSFAFQSVDRRQ